MMIVGKWKYCQKVVPFLWNVPTFKKEHQIFGTPRPLEPFLVDFEERSFYQYALYMYLACQPRNFHNNWSILLKMRKKFVKNAMEIYNKKVDWPCPLVMNFKVLSFGQFWSDLDEILNKGRFWWVYWTLKISRQYVASKGEKNTLSHFSRKLKPAISIGFHHLIPSFQVLST